jgi:hypothetical protein
LALAVGVEVINGATVGLTDGCTDTDAGGELSTGAVISLG